MLDEVSALKDNVEAVAGDVGIWDMMVMWGCRGSSHRTYGVWSVIRLQEDR